jgi:DNA repair protein RadC
MKIKDLPIIERPREKLQRYGPEGLSTPELLAILLGSGRKGENVVQMARRIVRVIEATPQNNSSIDHLKSIEGLGTVKACTLVASMELWKRLLQGKQSVLVMTPEDVWRELGSITSQKKEHFVVFYLDIRNQVIKKDIISIGTLTASIVHPREVFEPAIRDGAAQIILSHNHPSGVVEPSQADRDLTKRLVDAGKILGIEIIDHIVVSKKSYYSFVEHKLL